MRLGLGGNLPRGQEKEGRSLLRTNAVSASLLYMSSRLTLIGKRSSKGKEAKPGNK